MNLIATVTWTAVISAFAAAPPALAAPPNAGEIDLTTETYASWRDFLLPSDDEWRWREIPWRDSFYAGLKDAQIEGTPVLLWAMNGHPLGCV